MPLFPLPAIIAFVGWSAVFLTADESALKYGGLTLAAGLVAFLIWNSKRLVMKSS